jgi:hypothetical protein
MTLIKRTAGTSMAVACLLVLLFVLLPGTTALAGAGPAESVTIQSRAEPSPSPSPTLGSTESPPNPPAGDRDSDPADYSGVIWIVLGVAVAAVLIVGGTFYWFRGGRKDLNP